MWKKDLQVHRPVLSACGPGRAQPGGRTLQSASKPPQCDSFKKQTAIPGMSRDGERTKTFIPRTQGRPGQWPAVNF